MINNWVFLFGIVVALYFLVSIATHNVAIYKAQKLKKKNWVLFFILNSLN